MSRRQIASAAAILLVAACTPRSRLEHGPPERGSRAYQLRWRGAGRFVLAGGPEQPIRSELRGRLLLERAPGTAWRARLADARLEVQAPARTGLGSVPQDPGPLTFHAIGGAPLRLTAIAGAPLTVAALLAPKTLALIASFPPMPAGPVKRGARWTRKVVLSWPHPLGLLTGEANLRLRLTTLRRDRGRLEAVIRIGGDVRLAGTRPEAPAYRGTVQAEVLLDVGARAVRRAAIEEDWIGAYREPGKGEARMRSKGEWSLKLVAK